MAKKNVEKTERELRLESLRSAQQRRERSRLLLLIGSALAVALVLIAVVSVVVVRESREQAAVLTAAEQEIEGVVEYEDQFSQHVSTPVEYEVTPPVGGNHNSVWTNCGIYDTPTTNENSVHSLEHGAVWITYSPDLPTEQVDTLKALAATDSYVLLSPYEGLPSPVVASAWGLQLQVESADDERLPVFLAKYLQGPQTPEPGAACFGGIDG